MGGCQSLRSSYERTWRWQNCRSLSVGIWLSTIDFKPNSKADRKFKYLLLDFANFVTHFIYDYRAHKLKLVGRSLLIYIYQMIPSSLFRKMVVNSKAKMVFQICLQNSFHSLKEVNLQILVVLCKEKMESCSHCQRRKERYQ